MLFTLTYSEHGQAVYFIFSRSVFRALSSIFFKRRSFFDRNYFLKKLLPACLTRFWRSLCSLNHKNKQIEWGQEKPRYELHKRTWDPGETLQAESNDIKKQSPRGKHLCQSLFFNNVTGLRHPTLLKKTLAQVFSCEFCEISKNSFSYKTPLVTASGLTCKANSSNLSIQRSSLCLLISCWFFYFINIFFLRTVLF